MLCAWVFFTQRAQIYFPTPATDHPSAQVLVVIAGEDEIIPRQRSQALIEAFRPEQVQVVVVPGVGHNTLDLAPEYLESVRMFLSKEPTGAQGSER